MKKQNKLIIALFIVLTSGMFSSCNFLNVDNYFLDTLKEDSIFHTRRNAEGYLWNTATLFPSADRIWGGSYAPGELATDELIARYNTSQFPGIKFTIGEINAYNVSGTSMYIWNNMYKVVNRCNEMLKKVNEIPGMSNSQKAEYVGYVHFMRGYAYYFLLQNWGPLLIVGDDVIDSTKDAEYFNKSRSTYDESVDYIVNEFELAAKTIPRQERMALSVYGRPSKGAAFALIARLRLQQASPLFNGGTVARKYFGNWIHRDRKDKDGKPLYYVSQELDEKKWAMAAHAAKRVIDMGAYELHTVPKDERTPELPANVDPNGYVNDRATASSIDPYHSYKDMFSGESLPKFNKEIIWGIPYPRAYNVRMYIEHSFPRNLGGWGGFSVPQKVVDKFYMVDGKTIDNASAEYPYDPDPTHYRLKKNHYFSGYKLLKQYKTPRMYENREMRFYANIGFSGRYWPLNSATHKDFQGRSFTYEAQEATGKAGAGNNENDYTCTGYVPVKYIHDDDALKDTDGNNNVIGKSFPIIRYAEILLIYAEALNELSSAVQIKDKDAYGEEITKTYSRDEDKILKHFNMIRYRVGLPGVKTLPSKEEMRDIIKRERDIEFFNENQRFYDVRRWGDYLTEDLGSTFTGLNVEGEKKEFYQIVSVNTQVIRDRVTDKKMIWLPLSHNELLKVPKMDQNPGYNR